MITLSLLCRDRSADRIELDRHAEERVERVVEASHRSPRQTDLGDTRQKRLQQSFRLQTCHHLAEALMDSKPKADVTARLTGDVEAFGLIPSAAGSGPCAPEKEK